MTRPPGPATSRASDAATCAESPGPAAALVAPRSQAGDALTVYYDGSCPVCSREIAAYRRQDCTAGWDFVDVAADAGPALGPGLTREAALRRMHVRRADGSLVDGAAAFVEMWARVPALAWLARLCRLPGMAGLAEGAYRLFLVARPLWRRAAPPGVPSVDPAGPPRKPGTLPTPPRDGSR